MNDMTNDPQGTVARKSKLRRGLIRGLILIGISVVLVIAGMVLDDANANSPSSGADDVAGVLMVVGSWFFVIGALVLLFYGILWLVKVGAATVRED